MAMAYRMLFTKQTKYCAYPFMSLEKPFILALDLKLK